MPVKSAAWTLPLLLPCKPQEDPSRPPSARRRPWCPANRSGPPDISSPIAWQTDLVGHAIPLISATPAGDSPVQRFPPSVVRSATGRASPPATQIEVDGQARASTLSSPRTRPFPSKSPPPVPHGGREGTGWGEQSQRADQRQGDECQLSRAADTAPAERCAVGRSGGRLLDSGGRSLPRHADPSQVVGAPPGLKPEPAGYGRGPGLQRCSSRPLNPLMLLQATQRISLRGFEGLFAGVRRTASFVAMDGFSASPRI